ncbi:hypothetical protein [Parabacteroides sp.]
MRHYLFLFTLLGISSLLPAQTDRERFERMREGMHKEYNAYRKEIERVYADYLRQTWKEYQLSQGIKPYENPKPDTLPSIPKRERPAYNELQAKDKIEIPVTPKLPDLSSDKSTILRGKQSVSISFYGTKFQLSHNLPTCHLKSTDTKDIANAWENLGTPDMHLLLSDLITIKQSHRLNDWAFFRLIEETAKQLPQPNNANTRILFRHFALLKCGYDIRIGLAGEQLILLVPFAETLHERSFLPDKESKKKYYLFSDQPKTKAGSIYTVPLSGKENGRIFSLQTQEDMILAEQLVKRERIFRGETYTASINKNRIEFFNDYPSCDFQTVADTPVDPKFEKELFLQINPRIQSLSISDALRWLLHFTQSAFQYATDQEQLGMEKYLYPEETFFYPKSDCEDRAIFFAWIVRKLLHLEVALMLYKDHMATGVILDQNINGHYIRTSDRRYLLCDPTFMGADIGRCASSYKAEQPVVIQLKHK